MCGICGIVESNRSELPSRETLVVMNNTQMHRGPDDDGYYIAPGVGFGMRRLSIIDVAGGAQPQSNENGTLWVIYNGEIYNYLEVKAELEAYGHNFRTRSDTEVILHGYEEWGTHVVEHLNGMFAIALWDTAQRRLMLARDRFGVKPLIYTLANGRLLFASSVRAILAEGSVTPRANLHALEALFTVGFVPAPLTMFEGIYNVPAAHRLIFENGELKLERYWDIEFTRETNGKLDWNETVEQFRTHLNHAVKIRRMSEVPLGALLSGGIDSTSIVALLQRCILSQQSPEPIHTVSIGFDAAGYDESAYAGAASDYLGTQHHAFTFSEADFERLPQVIAQLEQPQCSATCLPIYLLYEKCRAVGLTVVLTGEGSDELLGGYHWYRGDAQVQALLGLPASIRALIASAPLKMSPAARRVLSSGARQVIDRYAAWQMVASSQERARFLAERSRNGHTIVADWRESFSSQLIDEPPLHQMQYVESHTRLIDFINFEVDRLSMAHSIEARAPFLDYRLWEFCAALPAQMKTGGALEKNLLRAAMRGSAPPAIVERPKQGLASPHRVWLKHARLPDWAEDALSPHALATSDYFVPGAVTQLRREHIAGQHDHSRILMGILSTQVWHDEFFAPAKRENA
jgi:asparagine synthase (glutamine-hydrolysing)